MTPGFLAQIVLIALYVLIIGLNIPAFKRIIRGKSRVFDGIKTCCGLLALAFINSFIVISDSSVALFESTDLNRILASLIRGGTFVMLCVVLFRTEKAMNNAKHREP